ncbi:hypothetical protein PO124_08510 [Bacillus licheniformis]|nr:hypothetical protein [Bacillus licheniformis]
MGRERFEASKQTKTKGTVCAPLTLFAEYKTAAVKSPTLNGSGSFINSVIPKAARGRDCDR